MEFRERTEPAAWIRRGFSGQSGNGTNLPTEENAHLAAADEALEAALSGNSLDSLDNVRQTIGE
jgi:hypothetical protein